MRCEWIGELLLTFECVELEWEDEYDWTRRRERAGAQDAPS